MFVEPESIIKVLDVLPGMKVADFGSGAGFYTIPLAKKVGAAGKTYAIDIRSDMLDIIRSKAIAGRLLNVEVIRADLEQKEGSHIKDETVDLVIISNVLFQVNDKSNLAREAFRILKKEGRVVMVEWDEEKKSFGPPLAHRINRQEAEDIFLKTGFVFDKELNAGDNHYGLILKKNKK
ncbi:methyltransferase domain-containing protein [Candidatus Giovannonibacteria bacterium]|nr:methyltransferase domain-containing protein [Candidatus Giovannonibacteria bacterium]